MSDSFQIMYENMKDLADELRTERDDLLSERDEWDRKEDSWKHAAIKMQHERDAAMLWIHNHGRHGIICFLNGRPCLCGLHALVSPKETTK